MVTGPYKTVMVSAISRQEQRSRVGGALLAAVMALAAPPTLRAQVPAPGVVDLSVFLGAELPTGRLADRTDPGVALGGDAQVNLPFWRISVLGNVSYALASAAGEDFGVSLLHYSVGIEKDFVRTGPLNRMGFFANSGIGGFRFDPDKGAPTTDLSVHLGLGVELTAGPLVGLRLEVRDYIIFADPDVLNTVTLTVALRIL